MKKIFFDSYNGYDFNEYKTILCECNDIDPEGVSDARVYGYISGCMQDDWRMTEEELEKICGGSAVLFLGSMGRWDGVKACGDYGDLSRLLEKLDGDAFRLYAENKHLFIESLHHDGCDCFEIKTITKEGQRLIKNWEYSFGKRYAFDEWELIGKLAKNYSRCLGGKMYA